MEHTAVRRFTLLEMLLAMVVAVILLTLAVPVFSRLTSGTAVESASRMLAADMRFARQYSIGQREYVAVLLPAAQGSVTERRFSSSRLCVVDGKDRFVRWLEDSKWTLFPSGAVVAEVDDTAGLNGNGTDQTETVTNLPSDFGGDGTCRAVIFRKGAGRLVSGGRHVHLVEGAAPGGQSVLFKNRNNYVDIEVDQYTGRVALRWPEDV